MFFFEILTLMDPQLIWIELSDIFRNRMKRLTEYFRFFSVNLFTLSLFTMQTTQTKVEYSGISATRINNTSVMSNDEDSGGSRHPTSLPINSNYRLLQRDRVNRFTTTTNNNITTTTTPSISPDSFSSPVDFESTITTSLIATSLPPPQSATPASTKNASFNFLSSAGIKQRLLPKQQPQSTDKTRTDEEELLHWKDMPKYLQFNPYVLRGYRPLSTFKGCCFSLFYWHNETVNIFTHGKFFVSKCLSWNPWLFLIDWYIIQSETSFLLDVFSL